MQSLKRVCLGDCRTRVFWSCLCDLHNQGGERSLPNRTDDLPNRQEDREIHVELCKNLPDDGDYLVIRIAARPGKWEQDR